MAERKPSCPDIALFRKSDQPLGGQFDRPGNFLKMVLEFDIFGFSTLVRLVMGVSFQKRGIECVVSA
jgi:hypothetical protein